MTESLARGYPERSTAMLRGFGRALDRASLAGGGMAAATSAIITVALTSSPPSWLGTIAGTVVGTLAGLAVARLLLPTSLLRAFEAFSWLGRAEMDRFEARTGGKVPVRRPDQERWLDEHASMSVARLERIEILAFLGRLDEARAELDEVVAGGPDAAFERASLDQYIGWLTDGDSRLEGFRAAVADLRLDGHHRRTADVNIALAHARERFMRDDPAWSRPLEEVRPSLERAPARVVLRDTWRPLTITYLIVAVVVASFASLLPALA